MYRTRVGAETQGMTDSTHADTPNTAPVYILQSLEHHPYSAFGSESSLS